MESAVITFTGMEFKYPRGSNNDNINNRYLEVALKLNMAKDPKSWSTIPIDAQFFYVLGLHSGCSKQKWVIKMHVI